MSETVNDAIAPPLVGGGGTFRRYAVYVSYGGMPVREDRFGRSATEVMASAIDAEAASAEVLAVRGFVLVGRHPHWDVRCTRPQVGAEPLPVRLVIAHADDIEAWDEHFRRVYAGAATAEVAA